MTIDSFRRLRILLLQARRKEDPMAAQEHACFVERTGLTREQITPHDLCQGPPAWPVVRAHDAVMVGGSGDFYISSGNLPHFTDFLELLRQLVEHSIPTFGSCFGYQGLVRALGGEVVFDPDRTEVGTFALWLTPAGSNDELWGRLPGRFWAQMGHKDRAICHPENVLALASSEQCPLQGLRVSGQPIWASQFHPELDRKTNQERYCHYLAGYAPYVPAAERDRILDQFRESPAASNLLREFLELVFG